MVLAISQGEILVTLSAPKRADCDIIFDDATEPEDFDPIEALFLTDGKELVVALRAFFDASARQESDVFCLAGVVYGFAGAKKARRDWRNLWGEKRFHMTDLQAGQQDFKDITSEEKHNYMVEAINIIRRHAIFSILTSFRPSEVKPLLPKVQESKGNSIKT